MKELGSKGQGSSKFETKKTPNTRRIESAAHGVVSSRKTTKQSSES